MILRSMNKTLNIRHYLFNKTHNVSIRNKTLVAKHSYQLRGYVSHLFTGDFHIHQSKFSDQCHKERLFSTNNQVAKSELDSIEFDKISNETLESLSDYFDELVENALHLIDADVSCRDGVLTVKFGNEHGTYVINRQTPNKQIWLSSPTSGPKRYDFTNGRWIYKHDGKSLHELLDNEISKIIQSNTNFHNCAYSGVS